MKKKIIISITILIFFFLFYKTFSFLNFLYSKPSLLNEEVIFKIEAGSSFRAVALKLNKEGLIKNYDYFVFLARLQKVFSKLQVGEYKLNKNMIPLEIMDTLIKGKVIRYSYTIPEGFNMYQVADLLASLGLIDNANIFILSCKDKVFVKSLNIPADTCEGYLFPDTYIVSRTNNARDLIKMMYSNFERNFSDSYLQKALELRLTKHQLITLASIIEKETGASFERPIISSVFHNRLKINMRLQSDPTTIYGIWETFNGNLTRKDLRDYTPFNTYVVFGLPPSPIANPGKAAIEAALYPEKTDYLFFVSKNDGTHIFTTNYSDHNKAVNQYQRTRENRVGRSWKDLKE